MKQITNAAEIRQIGTILSVWAHPDDESFTAAGIMATAVENGQKVACVTATKGEAGVQDESRWPAAKLGQIRADEMRAALNCLCIDDHTWLGCGDGHCQEVNSNKMVAKLKQIIDKVNPDSILTFGPDGMTGHPDHQTVSKWVDLAVKGTNIRVFHTVEESNRYEKYMVEADKKFNIYFNIDKPPVFDEAKCDIAYILPPDILFKKRLALKAMPSQTERMFKQTSSDMMNAMLAKECFVIAGR